MEFWDIYDSEKRVTGRKMLRNDWHMKPGDYHLTVLALIRDAAGPRSNGRFLAAASGPVRRRSRLYSGKSRKRRGFVLHRSRGAASIRTAVTARLSRIITSWISMNSGATSRRRMSRSRKMRSRASAWPRRRKSARSAKRMISCTTSGWRTSYRRRKHDDRGSRPFHRDVWLG